MCRSSPRRYTSAVESTRSRSLLARLLGRATPGSALADTHRFLQQRVTLYIKILLCFFAAFAAMAVFKMVVLGFFPPEHMSADPELLASHRVSTMTTAFILGGICLFLTFDWWYLSRKQRSVSTLHWVESGGTVFGCTVVALKVPLMPEGMPPVGMLFPVVLALIIRASLVPSSPRRTLLVGLLAIAGFATTAALFTPQPVDEAAVVASYSNFLIILWGLVFSLATAIVSRVIYGLQKSVREAMQLGNYTLDKKIGEGGMGMVYLAHHAMLRRPTAVKLLPPEKAGEHAIARFEREVQNSSRLSHPNTVQIFDFGRTPEGIFYYAMEYLEGVNLAELIELEGPQPPGRVIHLLAQVAHALAEAHEVGLIHRDIKPANIIVCNRGGVADMAKVVDFGLVKDIGASNEPAMTAQSSLTGTPLYMAPEAFTNPDGVDERADLYALGAVGFYLLTGEHVFNGSNAVAVAGHHMHSEPDRPSARIDGKIAEDLEAVILRALAKKPDERFDNVEAMRRALLDCGDAQSWSLSEAATWWAQNNTKVHKRCAGKCEDIDLGMANTIAIDLQERMIA